MVIKRNLVSVNILGLFRDMVQLVARVLWEHEVVGSNPAIPTQWVVSSMVEQEAVNFEVIGSSPILPAKDQYKIHW